ncbi:MAG: hypothetical protein Q9195_007361 [Heterodermia aff. obscurata]
MAGVEAIGLALGVLPLLISAIEHYDDILRPFSRYRSSTSKAQRFVDELETERTIFRTECQLLLAVVTGPKVAAEMLRDHHHASWDDEVVRDRLIGQLGVLGTACTSLISKIEEKLCEIGKRSEQLGTVIVQAKAIFLNGYLPHDTHTPRLWDRYKSLPLSMSRIRKLVILQYEVVVTAFGHHLITCTFLDALAGLRTTSSRARLEKPPPIARHLLRKAHKSWRNRVATKLKFSFSESGLRQLIKDLRILNKNFLILSNQAARLDSHYDVSQQPNDTTVDTYAVNHEMEKFQRVQHASQILHDALSRACKIHPEHVVQLCLLAKCTSDELGLYNTRFTLAFSHTDSSGHASLAIDPTRSNQTTTPCDMIWFEIESVTGINGKTREDRYTGDAERPPVNDVSQRPKWEKSVSTSSRDIATSSASVQQVHLTNPEPQNHQDLCMHLSQISVGAAGSYFYTLEQIRGCRHFVHGPVSLSASRSSISLAQLITQGSGEKLSGELPQYQRLAHAKALTLAVLQFHPTPWLSESWKSDNVFFCGSFKGGSQQHQGGAVPHLNATVAPAKSTAKSISPTTTPSALTASVVPNLLLFDLGVMLLELAYNAPFQALRLQQTLPESANTAVADFTVALTLADQVGIFLGAGFAAIVKKCLRCDFGCGNSLDHPALQARLYEDVVCKLERLEEGFRKLQLND